MAITSSRMSTIAKYQTKFWKFFLICVFSIATYSWSSTYILPHTSKHGLDGSARLSSPSPSQNVNLPQILSVNQVRPLPSQINPSLTFKNQKFYLKGEQLRILAGSVHYFRIVPKYWFFVLQKLKACGLNTVVTYVPWNLHEPSPNQYVFQGMLDLQKFLNIAQFLKLYVILRPGPYICSEWDFGGLPSWLLRTGSELRSNSELYMLAVDRYFRHLFSQVVDYQHSKGGPIIAFQIENEYGAYSDNIKHLENLRQLYQKNGIHELLLLSDGLDGIIRARIPNVLLTANFANAAAGRMIFDKITEINPDNPLMVMEFWTGWFDHWGNKYHQTRSVSWFKQNFQQILDLNASFNFYMFMGGTNFGFMAGANIVNGQYHPDVTSYDYDALLTESGDITDKYLMAQKMIYEQILKPQGIEALPTPPDLPKAGYGKLTVSSQLSFQDMLDIISEMKLVLHDTSLEYMELLEIKNKTGQSYGYILYEKLLPKLNELTIDGIAADRAQILVNHQLKSTLHPSISYHTLTLSYNSTLKVGILVENLGRVNYIRYEEKHTYSQQYKGLRGDVYLDGVLEPSWHTFPLEFSQEFLERISKSNKWKAIPPQSNSPAMYRIDFKLSCSPKDTFLQLTGWVKGIVIVNNFNLGRYWNIGPQLTLYLPAPLLHIGLNVIYIFEEKQGYTHISSVDQPTLGRV
ncbi:beta-galactosidase-1-like protein 2 [Argonauta hians]